jgi:hypothetical protein
MPNGATVPGTRFGPEADSAQCAPLLPNCRDDGLGGDLWLVCVVVRDSRLPSIDPVSALPVGRQSDDLDCRIENRDGRCPSRGPDALSEVRLEVYVFWGVEISHSGRYFPSWHRRRLPSGSPIQLVVLRSTASWSGANALPVAAHLGVPRLWNGSENCSLKLPRNH